MTFATSLSNAISGMNAATTAIQVRSNNIANASTPGYVRRDVNYAAGVINGVRILSISHAEDQLLTRERYIADSQSGSDLVQSTALNAFNDKFGKPGDAQGLFSTLSRFTNAIEDLKTTPESPSYQEAVLFAAQSLSGKLNQLSNEVTTIRSQSDQAIASSVDTINRALETLQGLNAVAERGAANELSDQGDQRRRALDTISKLIDIRVTPLDGNKIRVTTAEGILLLGDEAQQIEFTRGGVATPDVTRSGGQLSGISVNGINISPGEGAQGIESGELFGHFAVRDQLSLEFNARIDAFAEELISRFSDSSVDATLNAGDEGLFVSNGAGTGQAFRIGINAAIDPAQGGEIWRIRDGINATTPGPASNAGATTGLGQALASETVVTLITNSPSAYSLLDATSRFASIIGTQQIEFSTRAAGSAATAQALNDEELTITGVNTDQELQSLLLIEQAYAANARVVQAVSDMMARLMEI